MVLILVLMEFGFCSVKIEPVKIEPNSLNPCSNGIWFLLIVMIDAAKQLIDVLILILLEVGY